MLVIEFLGMPRSGKTTQSHLLKKYLENIGEIVTLIEDREIEREVKTPLDQVYEYNMEFFTLVHEKILSSNADVIILDRGFYDASVWFCVEHKNGKISSTEKEKALIHFKELQKLVDKAVFFPLNPNESMRRMRAAKQVSLTDDYVFTKSYLQLLNDCYELSNGKNHFFLVDGTLNSSIMHKEILAFLQL